MHRAVATLIWALVPVDRLFCIIYMDLEFFYDVFYYGLNLRTSLSQLEVDSEST